MKSEEFRADVSENGGARKQWETPTVTALCTGEDTDNMMSGADDPAGGGRASPTLGS